MRNQHYLKLLAIATAFALTTCTVTANVTAYPVYAADKKAEDIAKDEAGVSDSSSDSTTPTKDETVYAKIDTTGSVKEVIVSDQLQNFAKGQIKDKSDLSDIENTKGDEKNTKLGSSLVWEGNGNDITYQGSSDKELPVSVKVTYKLDGKEISAKDLEGKSGKLTIRYDYENSCKSGDVYVPFLMTTAMILDTDTFSKVKTTNGKIISDGTRDIVVGMGLPKVAESLGVEDTDVDIPEYFEMTANVKDYQAVEAVTVATNDIFSKMDDSDFDSLDTLEDSVGKLRDASNTLVDGSQKLSDGLNSLMDKSGEMVSGVNKLAAGSGTLADGTASLSSGMKTLQSGVKSLNAAMKKLKNGTETASNGADQLYAATSTGSDLGKGAKSLQNALSDDGTANTIGGGVSLLRGGLSTLASASGGLTTAVATLNSDASAAGSAKTALYAVTSDPAFASLSASSQSAISAAVTQLATSQGTEATVAGNLSTSGTQLASGVSQLQTGATKLSNGVKQAKAGAGQLYTGITGDSGLHGNLGTLSTGLKTLNSGAKQLQSGGNTLASGADNASAAAAKIAKGSKTLDNGISTLKDGSGQLVDGVKQLDSGASKLSDGMIQFNKDGIEKLTNVFDNDVEGMLNKLTQMTDASKSYNNFSGISEGTKGTVKFIFVTDEE